MKKKINDTKKSNNKRLLTLAVLLTVLLAFSIPVVAWFSNQRGLVTMTKIEATAALNIGAGNKESCAYIDMSGIDVSDPGVTSKDFVFCVYSSLTSGSYNIQLAHTTNIQFTYDIYKANVRNEDGTAVQDTDVIYHSNLNNNDYYYYFNESDKIEGRYINKDSASIIANDSQHEATYSTYSKDYVQKNAEPLYWQNDTSIRITSDDDSGFADYYILRVSWNPNEVKNDKETDMVYITAGMVN